MVEGQRLGYPVAILYLFLHWTHRVLVASVAPRETLTEGEIFGCIARNPRWCGLLYFCGPSRSLQLFAGPRFSAKGSVFDVPRSASNCFDLNLR